MTTEKTSRKTALVTGAGTGIGKACAAALLKAGYQVVYAGRRVATLDAAIDEAVAQPGVDRSQALAVAADVSDPASVEALFAATQARFGRLDLLFNNAGIATLGASIEDVPFDQWKRAVDINLTGAFLCTQHAFRLMKAQSPKGGRIINNGSISAHVPRPASAPYTATKHAITGLTKSTALDGRVHDIVCSQIDIGNAVTEISASFSRGALQANGEMAVEPTMDVRHVGDMVVHMAGLPLEANVQFVTIMATKMPFIGRG